MSPIAKADVVETIGGVGDRTRYDETGRDGGVRAGMR